MNPTATSVKSFPFAPKKKENKGLSREHNLKSKYYLRLILFKERSKIKETDFRNTFFFHFFPSSLVLIPPTFLFLLILKNQLHWSR